MAHWAIAAYSEPGETVLDPFCGKGTAPLEALLAGRHAIGSDLAPDAFVITHAKVSGVRHKDVESFLNGLELDAPVDLTVVPSDVLLFYHPETLRQILVLRRAIFDTLGVTPGSIASLSGQPLPHRKRVAIYVLACLLGCSHGPVDWTHNRGGGIPGTNAGSVYLSVHCNHTYSASPAYVRRYITRHGLEPPVRDVVAAVLKKSALAQVDEPPQMGGRALCRPAESLRIQVRADLVVTSPPYFRAQTYAWDNWLRLWLLGYEDYRAVARMLLHTASIPTYYQGILASCRRIRALLRPGARAVVVVGDVQTHVKGKQQFLQEDDRWARFAWQDTSGRSLVNTSEVIADAGSELGFDVECIIDDLIPRGDRALAASLDAHHGTCIDRAVVLRRRA